MEEENKKDRARLIWDVYVGGVGVKGLAKINMRQEERCDGRR